MKKKKKKKENYEIHWLFPSTADFFHSFLISLTKTQIPWLFVDLEKLSFSRHFPLTVATLLTTTNICQSKHLIKLLPLSTWKSLSNQTKLQVIKAMAKPKGWRGRKSLPKLLHFSSGRSLNVYLHIQNFKTLASLCSWVGQFESYLVTNPGLICCGYRLELPCQVDSNEYPHFFMEIWATAWQNHPPVWSVFAVHMQKPWILSYPLCAKWRLWSHWMDAKDDLSLRWAHMSFCWFVRLWFNFINFMSFH